MSDNVRLWMGAFKSMSVTERSYGIILFLSPTLVDFHIPNKEIKMMAAIILISSAISVCKLCQFEALISCRNYIIAH